MWRRDWGLKITPFGNGQNIIKYLGAYVCRTAIAASIPGLVQPGGTVGGSSLASAIPFIVSSSFGAYFHGVKERRKVRECVHDSYVILPRRLHPERNDGPAVRKNDRRFNPWASVWTPYQADRQMVEMNSKAKPVLVLLVLMKLTSIPYWEAFDDALVKPSYCDMPDTKKNRP